MKTKKKPALKCYLCQRDVMKVGDRHYEMGPFIICVDCAKYTGTVPEKENYDKRGDHTMDDYS